MKDIEQDHEMKLENLNRVRDAIEKQLTTELSNKIKKLQEQVNSFNQVRLTNIMILLDLLKIRIHILKRSSILN